MCFFMHHGTAEAVLSLAAGLDDLELGVAAGDHVQDALAVVGRGLDHTTYHNTYQYHE